MPEKAVKGSVRVQAPKVPTTINDDVAGQMSSLNSDFNKNVKTITSIVDTLLNNYKSDPESFENGKVWFLVLQNFYSNKQI